MMRINKFQAIFLILSFATSGLSAADLLSFDKYNLSVVRDGKNIYGYYVGQSHKTNPIDQKVTSADCHFFFRNTSSASPQKIRAFRRPMKTWDSAPYSANGEIEIKKKTWLFEFDGNPSECFSDSEMTEFFIPTLGSDQLNKAGAFDRFNQENSGAKFTLINSTPAVGIRWTVEKSTVFNFLGGVFNKTTDFIEPGQPLTLIKIKGDYSLVRHVGAADGKIVNGWIKNTSIYNPFPR